VKLFGKDLFEEKKRLTTEAVGEHDLNITTRRKGKDAAALLLQLW
jgi:hypothetical protein